MDTKIVDSGGATIALLICLSNLETQSPVVILIAGRKKAVKKYKSPWYIQGFSVNS